MSLVGEEIGVDGAVGKGGEEEVVGDGGGRMPLFDDGKEAGTPLQRRTALAEWEVVGWIAAACAKKQGRAVNSKL
jgi:hypothetical protein